MEDTLRQNFKSIQEKIDGILLSGATLDIKQISDLERYVNMQETIVDSIYRLRDSKNV